MKLRARWRGPLPRVGDYLASATRPRYGYRISAIDRADPLVRWNSDEKAEERSVKIDVDRVPIADVPPSARVHPWRWDKRAKQAPRAPR